MAKTGNMFNNAAELTDDQIESLAKIICMGGVAPEQTSEALLVLMDEIAGCGRRSLTRR